MTTHTFEEVTRYITYGVILMTIIFIIYFAVKGSHKDNFRFQVTPEKLCRGGPYLFQGGPHKQFCQDMWNSPQGRQEMAKYFCLNGDCGKESGVINPNRLIPGTPAPGNPWGDGKYVGLRKHMRFTPMSDALWENKRCCQSFLDYNDPSVF